MTNLQLEIISFSNPLEDEVGKSLQMYSSNGIFQGHMIMLTHWGLVTQFGNIDLGQHWLR